MKSDMKTWIRNYFDAGFYLRSNALFHLLTPNMIMFYEPCHRKCYTHDNEKCSREKRKYGHLNIFDIYIA